MLSAGAAIPRNDRSGPTRGELGLAVRLVRLPWRLLPLLALLLGLLLTRLLALLAALLFLALALLGGLLFALRAVLLVRHLDSLG